ncbi:MAG: glucosamine--fructose-6-phosphate aminotransferase (isomerizing), partial [Alteromonas macleodii]
MCGIVAYIGKKEAYPILIKGLKRLEYRGYDSAGISLVNSELKVFKCKGKVADLEAFVAGKDISGSIGIGHTRWATHGEPNDVNAHPHYSGNEQLAIIHNGIIENYDSLKKELIKRGHIFKSDTDTEVLIHLIEDIQANENLALSEAVRVALTQVVGAYAIAVLDKNDPNVIIGAKKGSPMVVGIGKDKQEFFLASDATPIIEYTKEVVYLDDEQIVELRVGKDPVLRSIENEVLTPYI